MPEGDPRISQIPRPARLASNFLRTTDKTLRPGKRLLRLCFLEKGKNTKSLKAFQSHLLNDAIGAAFSKHEIMSASVQIGRFEIASVFIVDALHTHPLEASDVGL